MNLRLRAYLDPKHPDIVPEDLRKQEMLEAVRRRLDARKLKMVGEPVFKWHRFNSSECGDYLELTVEVSEMLFVRAAKSGNGRIAYFCPHCNRLIEVPTDQISNVFKNHTARCFMDRCIEGDTKYHIVWWLEEEC